MEPEEGVIKFKQSFTKMPQFEFSKLKELNLWRSVIHLNDLLGYSPNKYGDASYGNLSGRLEYDYAPKNKKKFIITGTQTGNLENLTHEHYATVLEYHPKENLVVSEGPIKASSESMTHGTIYDQDVSLRFVFHVHSPEIWENGGMLKIPISKKDVAYGTPEMAREIERLFRETDARRKRIILMGGHRDGVITFGKNALEAGLVLFDYLLLSSNPKRTREITNTLGEIYKNYTMPKIIWQVINLKFLSGRQ